MIFFSVDGFPGAPTVVKWLRQKIQQMEMLLHKSDYLLFINFNFH